MRRVKIHSTSLAARALLLFLVMVSHLYIPGGLDAAETQSAPVNFFHESAEEPQLGELLNEFDYNEYISAGATEFEQMALLKDWVYNHIPYEINYNDSELRNSILILRRAQNGEAFLCQNFSSVYIQCSVSKGWTARYILLKKPTSDEHAGCDIWSNQYRKWVYIDPTWNIHIEKNGVPLSIYEIRKEWNKNRGMQLVYVFGAGKSATRYRHNDMPIVRPESKIWKYIPLDITWLSYAYEIAVLGRNDFFSSGKNGKNLWEPIYALQAKATFKDKIKSFFKKEKKPSSKLLFYDLNRVDITVAQPGRRKKGYYPGKADVRLNAFGKNNYTPNFMEFFVKINNEDWKISDGRLQMKLAPGTNVIRAQIMNKFGIVGPITVKYIKIAKGTSKKQ